MKWKLLLSFIIILHGIVVVVVIVIVTVQVVFVELIHS